jgi:hypothetical protein
LQVQSLEKEVATQNDKILRLQTEMDAARQSVEELEQALIQQVVSKNQFAEVEIGFDEALIQDHIIYLSGGGVYVVLNGRMSVRPLHRLLLTSYKLSPRNLASNL